MLENEFKTRGIIAIVMVAWSTLLLLWRVWRRSFFKKPPEILYHYSGQEGLLGFTGSTCLAARI